MVEKTLSDWLDWLVTLHPIPIDMRLSRLERLHKVANKLNLLPLNCKVVTVAGTNGKGSTVAAMESCLLQAGYRVGAYTSPHLLTYNERVRIQQHPVDDDSLCAAFEKINIARGEETLTYFEFGTLAALMIFASASLDIALLEVGMGGRLDAVNIVDADVAVITPIDLDHMQWLGNTREEIAFEKAGVIRSKHPVICTDFDVPQAIKKQANHLMAPLYCQDVDFGFHSDADTWTWWSKERILHDLPKPSIELQNAAGALQALLSLESLGLYVEPEDIRTALSAINLPGRFQIIAGDVEQIFDVAHNPHATRLLAQRLTSRSCGGKTHAVVAMLADKDKRSSILPLLSQVDQWFVSGLHEARGDSGESLRDCLVQSGAKYVDYHPSVKKAYQAALAQSNKGDRIVVLGSFHTVAEVMQEQNL